MNENTRPAPKAVIVEGETCDATKLAFPRVLDEQGREISSSFWLGGYAPKKLTPGH